MRIIRREDGSIAVGTLVFIMLGLVVMFLLGLFLVNRWLGVKTPPSAAIIQTPAVVVPVPGPEGATGMTGANGETGDKGDIGDTGDTGKTGKTGTAGTDGTAGDARTDAPADPKGKD